MDLILPFKIGEFAEAKSFIQGFRGAWFRCKVHDMRVTKSGQLEFYLEYIDYPGEDKEWIRVFQKNPAYGKQKSSSSSQVMLRPPFPLWYQGDQLSEHFQNSDMILSVCDTWKIGDHVDWLNKYCYWTGKITRLLNEDEVEIELWQPPVGEGQRYNAKHKDLRPALDWFLEKGWTVPVSQANGKCWYAAHLIHHKSDTGNSSSDGEMTSHDNKEEEQKSLKRATGTSQDTPGYSNLKPSPDTNSIPMLNDQTNTIATSMEKSSYHSDGAKVTGVGSRRRTRSSRKRRAFLTDLFTVQSPGG